MEHLITFSEVSLAAAISVGLGLFLESLLFLLIFWAMKQVNLQDDAACQRRAAAYRAARTECRGEFARIHRA